jgi:hypothetical protein
VDVAPSRQRVVKFFPNNPPERGEVILVDGQRMRVTSCRVTWQDRTWTLRRLRAKPITDSTYRSR